MIMVKISLFDWKKGSFLLGRHFIKYYSPIVFKTHPELCLRGVEVDLRIINSSSE